jgi:hypothetical protein
MKDDESPNLGRKCRKSNISGNDLSHEGYDSNEPCDAEHNPQDPPQCFHLDHLLILYPRKKTPGVPSYEPSALKSRKSTRIAVTPCTTTPPTFALLKARDLPRATPAMIPKIQAAENSHTAMVAIHQPIIITSFPEIRKFKIAPFLMQVNPTHCAVLS